MSLTHGSRCALGAALALCLATGPVHAGNNDACQNAAPVGNGATAFSTIGATTDGPSPCGSLASDIWFSYETGEFDGSLVIETCGSGYDTVLAVYEGCAACPPDEKSLLACNDDTCGTRSRVTVNVDSGACYLIQLGGFEGTTGSGTLTINKVVTPPNDDCADAAIIADGDTPFNTTNANTDGPAVPPSCGKFGTGFGADVWYLYEPTCDGTLEVSTCAQADFDTRLAAYAGTCAALELVACNDDGPPERCPGLTSLMEVDVICGQPVLLRLGGFNGDSGMGTLTLTCSEGELCPEPECPGNTNGDGAVDVQDLVNVITNWNTANTGADVNDDGNVDVQDLVLVITSWGAC